MVRSIIMGPATLADKDLDEARMLMSKAVDIQFAVAEICAAMVDINSHAACLTGLATVHGQDTQAEALREFRLSTPAAALRIVDACSGLLDAAGSLARHNT